MKSSNQLNASLRKCQSSALTALQRLSHQPLIVYWITDLPNVGERVPLRVFAPRSTPAGPLRQNSRKIRFHFGSTDLLWSLFLLWCRPSSFGMFWLTQTLVVQKSQVFKFKSIKVGGSELNILFVVLLKQFVYVLELNAHSFRVHPINSQNRQHAA